MTYILGLNSFHGDSSACLLKDGRLIAAAEEERFRRIKHYAGFPAEAIKWCLMDADIGIEDVQHVALNQDERANLLEKMSFIVKERPSLSTLANRWRNKKERSTVVDQLQAIFPGRRFRGKVHAVEHHLAHLASSFYASPFAEAVAVSVDGFGDFASTAWGLGRDTELHIADRIYFPHSLGIFYQALTQYLGFLNYGDEYKVMGLAPYGKPRFLNQMRQIVMTKCDGKFELNLDYFRHHRENIDYEWEDGSPSVGKLFSPELEALLGPARDRQDTLTQHHMDIARSVQAMYEESFFNLLNYLHSRYRVDAITVAGGCGMNSVANGKIALATPFTKVYVQAAAGDAGGAIGAAITAWQQVGGRLAASRMPAHDHAYWGPAFEDQQIASVLNAKEDRILQADCKVTFIENLEVLAKKTAEELAAGSVVGWFQGRMEWGPRALGNRSIVCDPRRADMKDILNQKIKRRESFRPFAPSVLREAVSEWFEQDDDVPFMMQVYNIRQDKRQLIPAVTHVDGSGRLQTVCEKTNRPYYTLIQAFRDLTGIPMVLNTSFNENEPVVCRPEEALETFLRTRMDVLVLGGWFIRRNQ